MLFWFTSCQSQFYDTILILRTMLKDLLGTTSQQIWLNVLKLLLSVLSDREPATFLFCWLSTWVLNLMGISCCGMLMLCLNHIEELQLYFYFTHFSFSTFSFYVFVTLTVLFLFLRASIVCANIFFMNYKKTISFQENYCHWVNYTKIQLVNFIKK